MAILYANNKIEEKDFLNPIHTSASISKNLFYKKMKYFYSENYKTAREIVECVGVREQV